MTPWPTPDDLDPPEDPLDAAVDDRADLDDGRDEDPSPLPPWQLDGREPWDRQFREPIKAFRAFTVYLNQGYGRSQVKVSQDTGSDRGTIHRWSRRWRWVERIDLWEEHRARVLIEAQENSLRAMVDRHTIAGQALIAAGLRRLRGDRERGVEPLDLSALSAKDTMNLVAIGARIERDALITGKTTAAANRARPDSDPTATEGPAAEFTAEELEQARTALLALLDEPDTPTIP
jgi:hypothetical protein